MDEENKTEPQEINKLKKSNKMLIITIVVLVLILLTIGGYFLYTNFVIDKDSGKTNSTETEKSEKEKTKDNDKTDKKSNIETIEFDKVNTNATLKVDPLGYLFLIFTDFYSKDLVYNKNLLDNTLNKFHLAYFSMMADPIYGPNIKEMPSDGPYPPNQFKTSIFLEYSETILTEPLTQADINSLSKDDGIEQRGEYIETYSMAGRGAPLFVLKSKEITYNPDTKIYTLMSDFVASKDKSSTAIEDLIEPTVLKWDEKLNYAKCLIEYTKEGENKKIKSIIFTK